jgi:FlaA1/EpsC-like NDP-sugar epimerase
MDEKVKTDLRFPNRYLLLIDIGLIVLAVIGSFALRLELSAVLFYYPAIMIMVAGAIAIKLPIFYLFGMYRHLWIYASINELKLITRAVTISSTILMIVMLVLYENDLIYHGGPRSAPIIDWLLTLIFIGGFRFSLRLLVERNIPSARFKQMKRVIIVGAGDAGALVVREMIRNGQLNLLPIGFLDDDQAKQKHKLHGVPVIGKIAELSTLLDSQQVDEVIIAIPSAPGKVVRLVTDICQQNVIPFRTIPGIHELIGGKVSVSRLREVDITDLVRREPARIDDQLVGQSLHKKRVLVTGAGGSIGRELCLQIARWHPARLVLLGHGENSIFETLVELNGAYPALTIKPVIGDIRDLQRINSVIKEQQPQVLFHAAAHKHVPLMEVNIEEAVTNNIIGTRNVIQVALNQDVERLVLISTDKAIRPANVMGATKRLAEMIVLDAAQRMNRAFSVVRFGNVLGSRGSVVPLFKQQIARGGPVTVTHPDMQRYFMTIPEAVLLVLQAAAMGRGGEIFLLNMGEQVRIVNLAEDLIRLSGFEPGRDIEIVFTGVRPGEKISEDLWEEGMHFQPTDHPDIFRSREDEDVDSGQLTRTVEELSRLAESGETSAILELLDKVIPSACVRTSPQLDMTSII